MKKVFITFFSVILLDQILKLYIKFNFFKGPSSSKSLISDVFELTFVENPGMAFGWVLPGEWGKLILTIFRIFAAFLILWYVRKLVKEKSPNGLIICISLIMAGAVGNIIDCVFYGMLFSESGYSMISTVLENPDWSLLFRGNVVDMFHFTVNWPEAVPKLGGYEIFPPIFNIADASISVGVITILIKQKKYFGKGSLSNKNGEENEAEVNEVITDPGLDTEKVSE